MTPPWVWPQANLFQMFSLGTFAQSQHIQGLWMMVQLIDILVLVQKLLWGALWYPCLSSISLISPYITYLPCVPLQACTLAQTAHRAAEEFSQPCMFVFNQYFQCQKRLVSWMGRKGDWGRLTLPLMIYVKATPWSCVYLMEEQSNPTWWSPCAEIQKILITSNHFEF